jgi:hypothetical protein
MTWDSKKAIPPPVAADDLAPPAFGLGATDATAWAGAAKIMADVWKNEESRFNNLNTRAAAVLSASAVVTTVLGFFSKNVLDTSAATRLSTWQEFVAKGGVYIALTLFVLAAAAIVFGVLRPGPRYIFGNNALVGAGGQAGQALSAVEVDQIAAQEYGAVYTALANRSKRKAYWLTAAYFLFFFAMLSAVLAACVVIYLVPAAPTG